MRFGSRFAAPALLALTAAAEPPEPTVLFTVPADHRLVEGIATDGHRIWLSSVLDRAILERQADGFRTIALPAGTAYPLGIAWDARRRWLWITTDCPQLPGIAKCSHGALIALDRRGRMRAQASVAGDFHPGDVSAGGGMIFVGDSQNGAIYRWNPKTGGLDPIVPVGVGDSGQESVRISGSLLVSEYSQGILRIDLGTLMRAWLPRPDGRPLNGIDGMTRSGDWIVAVRNGIKTPAIVAFKVDGTKLSETRTLASGGLMKDPTQVALFGDRLLVVGEAGWAAAAAGSPRSEPSPILSLPVPR